MMTLRRSSVTLRRGSLKWLANSDQARVLTYSRRSGGEEILIAINFSNRPFVGSVDSGKGAFVDLTPDVEPPLLPDTTAPERATRRRAVNLPALTLDAWGYRIFRRDVK